MYLISAIYQKEQKIAFIHMETCKDMTSEFYYCPEIRRYFSANHSIADIHLD